MFRVCDKPTKLQRWEVVAIRVTGVKQKDGLHSDIGSETKHFKVGCHGQDEGGQHGVRA